MSIMLNVRRIIATTTTPLLNLSTVCHWTKPIFRMYITSGSILNCEVIQIKACRRCFSKLLVNESSHFQTVVSDGFKARPSLFNKIRFRNYHSKTSNHDRSLWGVATFSAIGLLGLYFGFHQYSNNKLTSVNALEDNSKYNKFNFIADVVEKVSPAVVYIEIKGRVPFHSGLTTVSNGSGFVVREDGLILTNAHVVANKQAVVVKLQDGRSFDGRVQAVDPVSDLATVKINCNDMTKIPLGDSSKLRPGEWVIAMGSPLSLSNTVTAGIVSTVHRGSQELGLHNRDMGYIQTDAVINFGNSGGPLVNLKGEAIGINTMKVATGILFAIPSDYARDFLDKAEKLQKKVSSRGSVVTTSPRRRYVGITMLTLNPFIIMEIKQRMRDFPDVDHGVLIHKVAIGSPADSCGLVAGDVITKINSRDITSSSDVYKAIESSSELQFTIQRGQDTINVKVTPENVD